MSLTIYADTGYAAGAFNPKTSFPVLLTFDTEEDSAALSWGMVREAVGYAVYAGVRDDNMLPVVQGQLETTLDIGSLGLSESYAFKVVADLGDGRSVSSYLIRSGSNTVADVTVTTASQQALLAFPLVYGAIGYNVYLGSAQGQENPVPILQTHVPGQPWSKTVSNGVLIQGLINNTTYYFMVQPIFEGWLGRCTEVVGVTPAIPVPQNLVAVAGDGQASLSWDAAVGACSYNVYQSLTSNGEAPPAVKSVSTNSAIITGLTDGTEYFFKVTAVMCDGSGESAMSAEANATPFIPSPTGLTAQPCDSRVKLNWSASAGAMTYNVYASSTSGGETGPPVLTGITATTTQVGSLADGTAEFFKVTAVNLNGESAKSNEATATPFELLAPVVTPTAGDTQVTLTFTSQAGISYGAYVGTTSGGEGGTAVATGTGTGGTLDLVVNDLIDGTKYYFIVKATNVCGQNETSAEISATPVPLTQLSGLSWVLPCLAGGDPCPCAASVNDNTTLIGAPGASFVVTIRIRGVVENQTYGGGALVGNWYVGGSSTDPTGNTYKLSISDPPQVYYINPTSGTPGGMEVLDYQETVTINVGASVNLTAVSGDNLERPNPGNLSAPDDDPARPIVVVQPFHGQFAQIDAVTIS